MQNIKLYDIHGISTIENFKRLITSDEKYLYWDNKKFKTNDVGDIVFWIDLNHKIAVYSIIDDKEIIPIENNGKRIIKDLNYNLDFISDTNKYEIFYRFKIVEKIQIPNNWNYDEDGTFAYQVMAYNLFGGNLDNTPGRISKINDLLYLFRKNEFLLKAKDFHEKNLEISDTDYVSPEQIVTDKKIDKLVTKQGEDLTIEEINNLIKEEESKNNNSLSIETVRKVRAISRNKKISNYIKVKAGYRCESCGSKGFKTKYGNSYLEAHHLKELSKGGKDHGDNMVCLCVECHAKIHHGSKEVSDGIYGSLLAKKNI